ISRFLRANTEFHLTVAQASGNHRLVELLAPILDEMERLLHLGLRGADRSEEITHEHRRLISALEAGDSGAAVQEVLSQLHDAQAMVMRAFIGGALDSAAGAVVIA
ncbi:protein containing GntR, partial [mine drainage metagenome]